MAKSSVVETKRVRYEDDLYAWSLQQAALLRARRADSLDWIISRRRSSGRSDVTDGNSRTASASFCRIS